MKRGLFAIVFVVYLYLFASVTGQSGDVQFVDCAMNKCSTTATSSPIFTILSPTIVALYLFGRKPVQPTDWQPCAGLLRRLGAFYIDFVFIMAVTLPFLLLPLLLVEAIFTGEFRWAFGRDFARWTDFLFFVSGLGILAFWFAYNVVTTRKGLPTFGQYICGYQIVPAANDKKMRLGLRFITAGVAMALWPLTLFHAVKRDDKVFWWDKDSNSRAVLTHYA